MPWSPPAPRIREYVQAVRAIWTAWKGDGKLDYEGKHYRFTLMTPNFVPEPYDGPLPRLGVAAVGPVMLKVAAEGSDDGKLHIVLHAGSTWREQVMPILIGGLATRGPQPRGLRDLGRRLRRHRQGRRGGRQAVRLGALSRGLLRLDAGLLAGVRGAWAGRSRPQAQCHDPRRPVGQDGERGAGRRGAPVRRRRPPRPDRQGDRRSASAGWSIRSAPAPTRPKPSDMPPDLLQDLDPDPTHL